MAEGFEVARLDGIERDATRNAWIPIRRHLGIEAFGINAWSTAGPDEELIADHEESSIGHEELYVVIEGHATFTVGGEALDAPTGTLVFVRDPTLQRSARAEEGGATVLTVGAKPGEAFRISPWEVNAEVFPLFDRGEYGEIKQILAEVVESHPTAAGAFYNLACAEAQLGETDAAVEHLARAIEIHAPFAEAARTDGDLAPLLGDPRFAELTA